MAGQSLGFAPVISFIFAATSSSSSGGGLGSLLIFPVLFLGMYFVMIRPQRRRMREAAALQAGIVVDDEVLLSSGIYGFVSGIDDDGTVWVDIADGHGGERIEVRVARSSISKKITKTDAK